MFYPNPGQWLVIWTVAIIMAVAGLFLLGLEDLDRPSVAPQERTIAQKEAERDRACEDARDAQKQEAAHERARAEADEWEERRAWEQNPRNRRRRYNSTYLPPLEMPTETPAACLEPIARSYSVKPRREDAQDRLVKYLLLVTGGVGALLVWQFGAKPGA